VAGAPCAPHDPGIFLRDGFGRLPARCCTPAAADRCDEQSAQQNRNGASDRRIAAHSPSAKFVEQGYSPSAGPRAFPGAKKPSGPPAPSPAGTAAGRPDNVLTPRFRAGEDPGAPISEQFETALVLGSEVLRATRFRALNARLRKGGTRRSCMMS